MESQNSNERGIGNSDGGEQLDNCKACSLPVAHTMLEWGGKLRCPLWGLIHFLPSEGLFTFFTFLHVLLFVLLDGTQNKVAITIIS